MNNNFRLLTRLNLALITSFIVLAHSEAQATDPSSETIRLLSSQCAQCHGTTGNSLGDFDSIAGEGFDELYADLLDMKFSDDNEIMHKQIKGYTEDQLWFIADYYAKLPVIQNADNEAPTSD